MKKLFLVWAAALAMVLISCSRDNDNNTDIPLTPSQILASTPWETTGAKDASGGKVELSDPNVINFVGFAYFKDNGTFTMYNLDDSPKLRGDWSVSPDGKTRTIVAKMLMVKLYLHAW